MKLKINSELTKKIIFFVFLGILVTISLFGFIYQSSFDFLKETFNMSLTNLGLVAVLKILVGSFDSLKGFSDIVDKVFNFFLITNGLLFFQMTILKLSNLLEIRILILLIFLLCFVKPVQKIFVKILIILLFINPGLQLYISGVKIVSAKANLELGENIKLQLETINKGLTENKNIQQENLKEENEPTNKNGNVVDNFKDFFSKTTEKIISGTKELLTKYLIYIAKLVNALLEITVSYFVTIMILFLFLPIIYFIILYLLFRKYFLN